MFGAELQARADKLLREQKQLDEKERQKREKERILQERARLRQQQREEEASRRRQELLDAELREQGERQAALEANRGVFLRLGLRAAPADDTAAAARGIKRCRDKLVLPPSAGAALMAQDAPKNGAMFFQVTAGNGATTHAGVLDFTAPEGVVLLPSKVAESLFGLPALEAATSSGAAMAGAAAQAQAGAGAAPLPWAAPVADASLRASSSGRGGYAPAAGSVLGRVTVAYKRLPKATFVRLQPQLRAFHEEVGIGEEAQAALEASLMQQATLTEGDWIQVMHGGRTYALRVAELQPEPAVSLIDTDVAADVGPSIETEGYIREREEQLAREQVRLRQLEEEQAQLALQALEAAQAAERQAAEAAAEQAAERVRVQAAAAAALPPEPDAQQPHVHTLFRLPDGVRVSRRWALEDPVQALYQFVDSKGGGGLWPGSYQLVAQYPRRVLAAAPGQTLGGAGFAAGQQEALMVEGSASG